MASRLALRMARPLRAAATSASESATAAPKSTLKWPSAPSGSNATAADGSRVRIKASTADERGANGIVDGARNAHLLAPPAFPFLQPFFKVAHVAGVLILVSITLVTGYETIHGLVTVRRNRKEWEISHPEEHAKLLKEITDKKDVKRSVEREKYAVSAIDPAGDEKRKAAALAIAANAKKE